ncbi:Palmitoyltransferase PFA4 OS=Cryptococcus neoformans var, neoformans serotype D (strain B-3501A) GN=PFA4 PE=3 SV=1 [Rhizoctonia solani AG-1 IB]|uniref:Palmitoyltransferase PFA4 n=1 Tax=Thanatephorus cucumeris (strain AG1-IB / isolate 7/3/14) TaxID=1108050 RepID=A0A0B7FGX3_THACB|nr:Palmitoyltransferase PFA4 OS=Cryptococcus neoformans var, neoformans serotype D (strain B-3501A) GN=PFA4 PE=3 SV=1 [Rhizoctonia solani AG-1 IB]
MDWSREELVLRVTVKLSTATKRSLTSNDHTKRLTWLFAMGRLLGRIWVGFTLSLISFISYSSQIFIIWPWYGRTLSIPLLKLLVPFNILVGMVFWNYIWTVRTDPGTVPKGWKPDLRSTEGYEVKKLTGAPRYCRSCERYKPPRSHHCRQCKKCVLRMDHHCPWVNNCVGHFNYGHFIRFLFYVDVACSYHFAMISMRAWHAMNASGLWQGPSTKELVFIILNYAACTPVLLLVGGFSVYHFYCLASNQTTIEGWEKDKVATLVRRGKIREVKFPYHLGARRNIRAVLGEQAWLWCWPQRMRGSGVSFLVADGTDPETQFEWPPKDPNVYKDRNISSATALQKRLQGSPWTYGNDSFNPALRMRGTGNHPPYHPSYQPEGPSDQPTNREIDDDRQFDHEYDSVSTSSSPSRASSEYDVDMSTDRDVRMRRGSEGWEVRPLTNEEIVQRYARSRGLETETRIEGEPGDEDGDYYGVDEDEVLDRGLTEGSSGAPVPPPKYNVYVPEDPDSSEDEALGTHIGTYTNE